MAELFLGIDQVRDPEPARLAGAVLHALFIGVMVKWFMDPRHALSSRELAEGMRIVAEHMAGRDVTAAAGPPGRLPPR